MWAWDGLPKRRHWEAPGQQGEGARAEEAVLEGGEGPEALPKREIETEAPEAPSGQSGTRARDKARMAPSRETLEEGQEEEDGQAHGGPGERDGELPTIDHRDDLRARDEDQTTSVLVHTRTT